MQINRINNNIKYNTFKSGLNKQILQKEARVRPGQVENYFIRNAGYRNGLRDFKNIDLKNNKAYAVAFRLCADIFKNFSKKHNYSNMSWI